MKRYLFIGLSFLLAVVCYIIIPRCMSLSKEEQSVIFTFFPFIIAVCINCDYFKNGKYSDLLFLIPTCFALVSGVYQILYSQKQNEDLKEMGIQISKNKNNIDILLPQEIIKDFGISNSFNNPCSFQDKPDSNRMREHITDEDLNNCRNYISAIDLKSIYKETLQHPSK